MHTNFADWYRMLSIELSQVPLELRWQGVEGAAEKISKSNALDLVRLFFKLDLVDDSFESEFRGFFRAEDAAFPMRDNELELQVLAAAVITEVLNESDDDVGDLVALATSCVDFQGLRPKIVLSEIIEEALIHLHVRSDQMRRLLKPIAITAVGKSVTMPEAAKTQPTDSVTWSAIQPLVEKLDVTPNRLVKPLNEAFESLVDAINLQQEESNMLWWLFSGHSRDLKMKMSDLGKGACIVAGKELADLTFIIPGPLAAEAFLDKVLASSDKNKKVTLRDVLSVKAIKEWKSKSTKQLSLDDCSDICMLHSAIKQSAQSENDNEWTPTFAKRSGFSAEDSVEATLIATQAYRERLLLQCFK